MGWCREAAALSLRRFGTRPHSFLKNPTTTKRITAPITALMIAATMPPTRTKPASGKASLPRRRQYADDGVTKNSKP
jgi:hypothetical protein